MMNFGFDLRRIVTGHDSNNRSIVTLDDGPGYQIGSLNNIWNDACDTIDSHDATDNGSIKTNLSPGQGRHQFRWFIIPPKDTSISDDEYRKIVKDRFAAMGASHEQPDTTRHAAMHKTETIDYIILLSGHVTLLLDEDERDLKPFDVVVQRATNHAWENRGSEPALLCAILIDAEIT
jgi:naringenin degradation protein FdeH